MSSLDILNVHMLGMLKKHDDTSQKEFYYRICYGELESMTGNIYLIKLSRGFCEPYQILYLMQLYVALIVWLSKNSK